MTIKCIKHNNDYIAEKLDQKHKQYRNVMQQVKICATGKFGRDHIWEQQPQRTKLLQPGSKLFQRKKDTIEREGILERYMGYIREIWNTRERE